MESDFLKLTYVLVHIPQADTAGAAADDIVTFTPPIWYALLEQIRGVNVSLKPKPA